MDVVGSEIGQKMRSAIKAKLTELGCYVDDELPDYVMVMVANKRTRAQMEEDLQLFLGDNTVQFVNWLHQVLRKLQEVTIAPVIKKPESLDTDKDRLESKEKKQKDKKDKTKDKHKKSDSGKKSKKKTKEKKRSDKKAHKKKKSKDTHEMIRPNIPPLLMNMEKESEPSITDIFAGQILKNHGITIDSTQNEIKITEKKPVIEEAKRPIVPIIDPESITTQPAETAELTSQSNASSQNNVPELNITNSTAPDTREEQIKEITEIETKIQGLRQKLAVQLETMSDDEDFLNIRTEAEELMNDFADDVLQEISSAKPANDTPPAEVLVHQKTTNSVRHETTELEALPQIELNLPKRPIRERLGSRVDYKKDDKVEPKKSSDSKKVSDTSKDKKSPERFTPERDADFWKSAKRLDKSDSQKKKESWSCNHSEKHDSGSSRRLTSKVSAMPSVSRSVVRVRPRPRPHPPASALLMRAVADAHKSLMDKPPKKEVSQPQVKRALVLPMRRDAHNILIQVNAARDSDCEIDFDTESLADLESEPDSKTLKETNGARSKDKETEYVPTSITKKIINTNYVPSKRSVEKIDEKCEQIDEALIAEAINIHKTSDKDKEKGPTFVVTLDGFDPNMFLANKLKTEGLIDDDTEMVSPNKIIREKPKEAVEKKRLSDTSEESDTQVIINAPAMDEKKAAEKRKALPTEHTEIIDSSPPARKRKASPIVFDVKREEKSNEGRARTESASSDNHVVVTTTSTSNKYDALPPLSSAPERKIPCRSFPLCRWGESCAFLHPPCRYLAACARRGCLYAHPDNKPVPVLASQVVPSANFKSIQSSLPNVCKYFPNCANPGCHYYHPKPCRYGKNCVNKLECNFYHHDVAGHSLKWRP